MCLQFVLNNRLKNIYQDITYKIFRYLLISIYTIEKFQTNEYIYIYINLFLENMAQEILPAIQNKQLWN